MRWLLLLVLFGCCPSERTPLQILHYGSVIVYEDAFYGRCTGQVQTYNTTSTFDSSESCNTYTVYAECSSGYVGRFRHYMQRYAEVRCGYVGPPIRL